MRPRAECTPIEVKVEAIREDGGEQWIADVEQQFRAGCIVGGRMTVVGHAISLVLELLDLSLGKGRDPRVMGHKLDPQTRQVTVRDIGIFSRWQREPKVRFNGGLDSRNA
jgi:hypothetical protein